MTYYVYIDGTHTDTINESDAYTAKDYYEDYNSNWSGQPEELTDETVEIVAQDGSSKTSAYTAFLLKGYEHERLERV